MACTFESPLPGSGSSGSGATGSGKAEAADSGHDGSDVGTGWWVSGLIRGFWSVGEGGRGLAGVDPPARVGVEPRVGCVHLGSALIHTRPRSWRELGQFNQVRTATDRRIQLAGDYFSSTNLNTATAAGERAVRELQAHL